MTSRAYPIWTELATAGDDKAALEAGMMHHVGRGSPVSYPDAWNDIGFMDTVPQEYRASPQRKRIRELSWWLPGEVSPFECPSGT